MILGKEHAHQIRSVLRMSPERHIVVLDNKGSEYDVVLTSVRGDEVVGKVTQKRQATGEPNVQITSFQSLLAREKFEFVLQKGTEVGASRFVPVITARSLVRETAIKPEKLARWQRIITEAAEQSHRGRIPDLLPPVSFEKAMQELSSFEKCFIACEKQDRSIQAALQRENKNIPDSIAILIGPEGGFTEQEVQFAQSAGAVAVSLGPRILRTETAAIITTALILYELGQMEG